jgi:hypothetical protein
VLAKHGFRLEGLNPTATYNLVFSDRRRGQSFAYFTVTNVQPNGPRLEVSVPRVYRVTGNVVDARGMPMVAQVYIQVLNEGTYVDVKGPFDLGTMFPGTYRASLRPRWDTDAFVVTALTFRVTNGDVDLGDIVVEQGSCTVSGILEDHRHQRLGNTKITLSDEQPCDTLLTGGYFTVETTTSADGRFMFRNVPAGRTFELSYMYHESGQSIPEFPVTVTTNVDLGTIIVKPEEE